MEENCEKISNEDMYELEIAKLNKMLVASQAEKAVLQSQIADLTYKYNILQLYVKYGLSNTDIIENGMIIRKS